VGFQNSAVASDCGEREQVSPRVVEVLVRDGVLRGERVDDPVELGVQIDRVELVEDGAEQGEQPRLRPLRLPAGRVRA
jgi:hypothetical protein